MSLGARANQISYGNNFRNGGYGGVGQQNFQSMPRLDEVHVQVAQAFAPQLMGDRLTEVEIGEGEGDVIMQSTTKS